MEGVRAVLEQRGDELVAAVPAEAAEQAGLRAGSPVRLTPGVVRGRADEEMDRWLTEMQGKEPPPLVWENEPPRGSEIW